MASVNYPEWLGVQTLTYLTRDKYYTLQTVVHSKLTWEMGDGENGEIWRGWEEGKG